MRKASYLLPLIVGLVLAGCGSASDDPETTTPAGEVSIGALSPRKVGVGYGAEVENGPSLTTMADIIDCADVASRTDIPLIHLPTLASGDFQVVCFLEMVDPERPEHLPEPERVPGIVYTPPSVSIKADSFEAVLNAGGVLITVRRPDPYDPPLPTEARPNAAGGGYAPVQINGAPGKVYRIFAERVSALWYPTIDGQRLHVSASGGYSPDELVSILRRAEPGPPRE